MLNLITCYWLLFLPWGSVLAETRGASNWCWSPFWVMWGGEWGNCRCCYLYLCKAPSGARNVVLQGRPHYFPTEIVWRDGKCWLSGEKNYRGEVPGIIKLVFSHGLLQQSGSILTELKPVQDFGARWTKTPSCLFKCHYHSQNDC